MHLPKVSRGVKGKTDKFISSGRRGFLFLKVTHLVTVCITARQGELEEDKGNIAR